MKPRRALLAVYDKQGLVEFARGLAGQGVELVATGGTERTLVEAGLTVVPVPRLTGTEEMLEGRVKTLHPAIHAGILARREHPQDMATLAGFGFEAIDLVAVNLYPFAAVLAGGGSEDSVLEAIDIGGPTLLRAAAKNHRSVAAVSDPEQYRVVLAQLEAGGLEPELLRSLAAQAFATVSSYDALIAAHLGPQGLDQGGSWPARLAWSGQLDRVLRYGENPHQAAALYRSGGGAGGLAGAERLAGEELSYTNWLDADAAWGLARALSQPAAVVVKHTNPCGVAVADHLGSAFRSAYECDPRSAYGGVVAVNRPLDLETAGLLSRHFLELLVAPGLEDGVLTLLAAKPRL
ncbi:MAG: bifunctional phosphoribosylaminoimidazolecarboxamide formyltransferase/IMP cyclohydrolase, partial [Candidatus Dormibacteria bacterium]